MAIKLIKTIDPDNGHDFHAVTIEMPSDLTRDQLLEAFEYFMRAIGYEVCELIDVENGGAK